MMSLRLSTRRWIVVVGLCGVAFSLFRSIVQGPSLIDRFYALVLEHDTVFAKGFTEDNWCRVVPGMTFAHVRQLLGPPIATSSLTKGRELWKYSVSPADTHYWRRNLIFRGGKVESVESHFYFD
jgi:hypothetical protein